VPVRPRRISDIKPLFTNLAVTSQYEVQFGGLNPELQGYLNSRGVDYRFTSESVGLLCNSASLPGSSFATSDINGNFTGLMEKFVHTRIYTPLELSFYVDKEYKVVKFLEHWMEFISSASGINPNTNQYFYKMKYPNQYKCDLTKVTKFNRDYKNELQYNFIGLFPVAMSSVSLSYESSSLMTVSATFNYERYVPGRVLSIDEKLNTSNNLDPNYPRTNQNDFDPQSVDSQNQTTLNNIQFGVDTTNSLNPNLTGTNALTNNPLFVSTKGDPQGKPSVTDWFNVSP
jgi:hypothetical protein